MDEKAFWVGFEDAFGGGCYFDVGFDSSYERFAYCKGYRAGVIAAKEYAEQ